MYVFVTIGVCYCTLYCRTISKHSNYEIQDSEKIKIMWFFRNKNFHLEKIKYVSVGYHIKLLIGTEKNDVLFLIIF